MSIKLKECKQCGQTKEASKKFFGMSDGYLCSPCNECRNIYRNKKREENPEKYKKKERAFQVARLYGVTESELLRMENKANHQCEICGIPFSELSRKPNVDHCHTTGRIRGLLCNSCNMALGSFKDDVDLLEKAVNYLRRKDSLKGEINYEKYKHLLDRQSV